MAAPMHGVGKGKGVYGYQGGKRADAMSDDSSDEEDDNVAAAAAYGKYAKRRDAKYEDDDDDDDDENGGENGGDDRDGKALVPHHHGKYAKRRAANDDDDAATDAGGAVETASVSSKRVFCRRGSGGGHSFSGVRLTRMRKMGKRAGVRMVRKEVHETMQDLMDNFVAAVVNDACVVQSGTPAPKTLDVETVLYILRRRGRPLAW